MGIKFVAVCPGVTITEFLDNLHARMISIEAYALTCNKFDAILKQRQVESSANELNTSELRQ